MRHNVRIALQATGALIWVTVAGQSCGRGITTSVTPLAPPGSPCVMADADRRWLRSAFAGWQRVVTRLALPDDAKQRLLALTPAGYTGNAAAQASAIVKDRD